MIYQRRLNEFNFDFSCYTGKGIKIAIIDSGIDISHPDIRNVHKGIYIQINSTGNISYSKDCTDIVGHGTACSFIIHKRAPDSILYNIKILDMELSAHSLVLAEAIKYAADLGVDVINISLGTTKKLYREILKDACNYANSRNVIIVAAANINSSIKSYPALFPDVIGVSMVNNCNENEYFYQPGNLIEFAACGKGYMLPWVKPKYISGIGTSFAAPRISGIIALILERWPKADFYYVKQCLIANAVCIL